MQHLAPSWCHCLCDKTSTVQDPTASRSWDTQCRLVSTHVTVLQAASFSAGAVVSPLRDMVPRTAKSQLVPHPNLCSLVLWTWWELPWGYSVWLGGTRVLIFRKFMELGSVATFVHCCTWKSETQTESRPVPELPLPSRTCPHVLQSKTVRWLLLGKHAYSVKKGHLNGSFIDCVVLSIRPIHWKGCMGWNFEIWLSKMHIKLKAPHPAMENPGPVGPITRIGLASHSRRCR